MLVKSMTCTGGFNAFLKCPLSTQSPYFLRHRSQEKVFMKLFVKNSLNTFIKIRFFTISSKLKDPHFFERGLYKN